jgi:Beta-galactosidase
VRLPTVIALGLIALALGAPGRAGASPSIRYGVQDDAWLRYGPGTLDARLNRLVSLGVEVVRINVLWPEVEPKRGRFDWSGYDPVIRGLHARGIEPVLTLLSTPRWANGDRGPNWAPTSGASFAAFAAAAARHYPFVRRWLIWNEPNQRRWLRPTSPSIYVTRLLNPAYAAIHRVRKNALVAGGVTAPRGSTGGVSPVAWIAGMGKAHAKLDAYAHNPYPLSPSETPISGGCEHCATITMATLPKLIRDVRRAFGPGTRIWLSEYGYQTNPPDPFLGVSDAKQAKYLDEAALRAYLAPRVDMLIQFLVQDEPDLGGWQSGLLTAAGMPKPSYAAFALPLAIEQRGRDRVTLWGQIRPGGGRRPYVLEELRAGAWTPLGGAEKTGVRGMFLRTVDAVSGTRFRVVELSRDLTSATLTS